jgi:hypothetical protein
VSSQKGESVTEILRMLCPHVNGMYIFTPYLEPRREDLTSFGLGTHKQSESEHFPRPAVGRIPQLTHSSHSYLRFFLGDEVVSSRRIVLSELSEPHVTQTEKHLE